MEILNHWLRNTTTTETYNWFK